MSRGRVCEQGTKQVLFYAPQPPAPWGLLGSIARLDRPKPRRLTAIPGTPPSLIHLPQGCAFCPPSAQRFEKGSEVPALRDRLGTTGHLHPRHPSPPAKAPPRDATSHPH